jgi:hypothetical protein
VPVAPMSAGGVAGVTTAVDDMVKDVRTTLARASVDCFAPGRPSVLPANLHGRFAPAPSPSHRNRAKLACDRFRVHADRCGDAADWPPELTERQDLLLLGRLQDIAHPSEGHQVRRRQRLGRRQ